jgi:hypothetical protein
MFLTADELRTWGWRISFVVPGAIVAGVLLGTIAQTPLRRRACGYDCS